MSDATSTSDPDGAIYPDGTSGSAGESGTPLVDEKPEYREPSRPADPPSGQVTSQVDGEMLIANLLVEIANLTRRALAAETMVQMYQRAAQPKSGQ